MIPIAKRLLAYVFAALLMLIGIVQASTLWTLHGVDSSTTPWSYVVWSLVLLAWPLLFAAGVRQRSVTLMTVPFVVYVGQCFWMGISLAGIHIFVGIPLFLVAVVFGWIGGRGGILFRRKGALRA